MDNTSITLLLGFIATLIGIMTPIIKLNTSITKLNVTLENTNELVSKIDKKVDDHEVRIIKLEERTWCYERKVFKVNRCEKHCYISVDSAFLHSSNKANHWWPICHDNLHNRDSFLFWNASEEEGEWERWR